MCAHKFDVEEETRIQQARDILLRYYSSKSTTHGEYIISLFVGLFVFFQIRGAFNQQNDISRLVFSLIFSVFPTLLVYLLARTVVWGTLSGHIITAKPIEEKEAQIRICEGIGRGLQEMTLLHRLHQQCCDIFRKGHRVLALFLTPRLEAFLILSAIYVFSLWFSFTFMSQIISL